MQKFLLVVIPTMENAYHRLKDFVAIPVPIGITTIAAVLEQSGHRAGIIDGDAEDLTSEELLDRVVRENPDYVGSTSMTATMDLTVDFYARLKKRLPRVKVVLGGPHVSALPTRTLQDHPQIDVVVRREGEETIVDLLAAAEQGRDLRTVRGIAFRTETGEVVSTEDRPLIEDLGKLPLPAYHLLRYDRYRSYGWNSWTSGCREPIGVVFTGRGCFGKCNFCAARVVFGAGIRFFPIERIKQELDLLVNQYKIRVLYFQDDTFTANRKMVNDVCDYLIEKGYQSRLDIMVSSRTDTVHLPTLQRMRQAGIRWICFGVESGNQAVLDRMHKNTTLDDIRNAFRLANQAGLSVAGNYMIGALGETWETAMDTINLACEMKQDYASFAITIPLPGSEVYEHGLQKGTPLPSWTGFGNVNSPPIPLNENLGGEQLRELRRLATNRFFKRPGFFLRLLWRYRAWAVITDFARAYLALRQEMKANRY